MRDSIQDIRIDDHLRIGRGRRGKPARQTTRPFFGPRTLSASPEAGENGVSGSGNPEHGAHLLPAG